MTSSGRKHQQCHNRSRVIQPIRRRNTDPPRGRTQLEPVNRKQYLVSVYRRISAATNSLLKSIHVHYFTIREFDLHRYIRRRTVWNMTSRAAPSGIALDIRRKLDASYDIDGELNARLWIEDVTGILMDDPPPEVESLEQLNEWRINDRELGPRHFANVLKDGIFLCKLINTLEPNTIKKIHEENLNRFKMTENIFNFLSAAKKWGCTEQDLFQTVDLYEERNMNQVLNGIYAVARRIQDRISDDKFPTLGPKEAKYSPRSFTEEQLNRGKHICALRF
ncbi:myophilin-like [Dendronephthya gigantea]|uniref:myophilin-like n=1 Tax=Dendronephthya gigantea TaxID=151771 RepID=UPI00106DC99E|nr:myophilin-like [Dendronephthya gigantea]